MRNFWYRIVDIILTPWYVSKNRIWYFFRLWAQQTANDFCLWVILKNNRRLSNNLADRLYDIGDRYNSKPKYYYDTMFTTAYGKRIGFPEKELPDSS